MDVYEFSTSSNKRYYFYGNNIDDAYLSLSNNKNIVKEFFEEMNLSSSDKIRIFNDGFNYLTINYIFYFYLYNISGKDKYDINDKEIDMTTLQWDEIKRIFEDKIFKNMIHVQKIKINK